MIERIDCPGLSKKLMALASNFPNATIKALQQAGARLASVEVQRSIAGAKPIPVDIGQYKATWEPSDTSTGCVVGNPSKHASVVELGRRPGKMPPIDPIKHWVYRHHKQFHLAAEAKAIRALAKLRKRPVTKTQSKLEAAEMIALNIARAIKARGIAGRYILKKSVLRMRPVIPKMIKACIAAECSK